jgi:hypothetical protein
MDSAAAQSLAEFKGMACKLEVLGARFPDFW